MGTVVGSSLSLLAALYCCYIYCCFLFAFSSAADHHHCWNNIYSVDGTPVNSNYGKHEKDKACDEGIKLCISRINIVREPEYWMIEFRCARGDELNVSKTDGCMHFIDGDTPDWACFCTAENCNNPDYMDYMRAKLNCTDKNKLMECIQREPEARDRHSRASGEMGNIAFDAILSSGSGERDNIGIVAIFTSMINWILL